MAAKRKSAFAVYSELDKQKDKDDLLKPLYFNHYKGTEKSKKQSKEYANNEVNNKFERNQSREFKQFAGVQKPNQRKNKINKKKIMKLERNSFIHNDELYNNRDFNYLTAKTNSRNVDYANHNKINKTREILLSSKGNKQSKDIQNHIQEEIKLKSIYDSHFDDQDEEFSQSEVFDSKQEALNVFQKIIHPITLKEFFSKYWEKKPLHIKRKNPEYYKQWFSCKEFHSILRTQNLEFTQNIDVTTYVNGIKEKHNPEGRAYAPLVWDFFQQGCSIRFLNPQTYSQNLWRYLSLLQELFCTSVGANTYLTPAGCQGFAPHYDDIEAFALQLEGKKRWRVYNPISEEETLPRFSSRNFDQNEIGDPIIDCVLETGDFLYFPRGFIHQANACEDIHSLHITVSCYQKNTYGDFLAKLLPAAVEIAMQEDVEFRKGLNLNYLENSLNLKDSKKKAKDKKEFMSTVFNLCEKLTKEYLPINEAIDQMAKSYIHDSLPPCLTESEKLRSIHGFGEKWNEEKNQVECIVELQPDTEIKLIRKNCARLVMEENACLLYHNLENSRIFQEKEPQYLEVETDAVAAIELLIKMYPKYVKVENLPMKTIEEKITVASCLYDKGLLVTGEPLKQSFETDSEDEESESDIEESIEEKNSNYYNKKSNLKVTKNSKNEEESENEDEEDEEDVAEEEEEDDEEDNEGDDDENLEDEYQNDISENN